MTDRWATFDCYGTLIDWERGIADTFARLWPEIGSSPNPLTDGRFRKLLRVYHALEPRVETGSAAPYRTILTEALRGVAAAERLELREPDADALARSLPDWPPFPEVPRALREVRERGWRVAILSNTDPDLLESSIRQLGVDCDVRITVAEAGSYKPAPGHWERFFATTGADRSRHVHVGASVYHDIEPAATLGLRAVWINRAGETSSVARAGELTDLNGLADVLGALTPASG